MKTKNIIGVFLVAFILTSCAPVAKVVPTETAIPMQIFTLVVPTPTTSKRIIPEITATPLDMIINAEEDLVSLIQKRHPNDCIGPNFVNPLRVNPPPPSSLEFNEINEFPNSNVYDVAEIAVSADDSREAVIVACKPENCMDHVYVKDNITGKAYQINWGGEYWHPAQRLIWVNRDILMFDHLFKPHDGATIAINVTQKYFEFFGLFHGCSQPTPTP